MSDNILLGRGRRIIPVPRRDWEQHLAQAPAHAAARLAFMTEAHRRVRYWVVRQLPRRAEPIRAGLIAQALDLPEAQVATILADLEQHLFFLVRNELGAVSWAFPVTVDPTPHALRFSSGEACYAA